MMRSSLKELFGPRVQVKAVARVQSGSPVIFFFSRVSSNPNTPLAARALAMRHMPMTKAHKLMTRLLQLQPSECMLAVVPKVEDVARLQAELAECGISAKEFDTLTRIDPKAVRARTGLRQANFAINYAIEEATVKNWEQGRTKLDSTARAYLAMIAADPEGARKLLLKAIKPTAELMAADEPVVGPVVEDVAETV